MIRSGEKSLELRVAFPSFSRIAVGDTLVFSSGEDEELPVEVTGVRSYGSVEEVMQSEDLSKLAPGMQRNQMTRAANKIFRKEQVDQHGLLILEFKKKENT